MFFDTHCHILHGLDDGADSIAESCDMIVQASSSGTTVMVATPHYNNLSQQTSKYNRSKIVEHYKELKQEVLKRKIPVSLFLGSEILADENIEYLYKNNEFITLNDTRYVLVEFNFNETTVNFYKYLHMLFAVGLIPVIAHPERYHFFENNQRMFFDLAEKGCKFQINKGSPLGKYGTSAQNTSIWLLNNDLVHLIASDCHSVNYRNSDMSDIYSWLIQRFSEEKISILTNENPKRILLDLDI